MATSQQQLVCDSSTLANFKQWAQAISNFFSTAGWSQSSDTGQVNWSTISSAPGSGAYVYEVWQPNDGLTNFYVKVEYGNFSGSANAPNVRLSFSTTTNGAGTLTGGAVMGPMATVANATPSPSATAQYECDFSGAPGRIGVMLWRTNTVNNIQQFFGIERSVNSSGAYTGTYVTFWVCGYSGSGQNFFQQTLYFGVGVTPAQWNNGTRNSGFYSCPVRLWTTVQVGQSSTFNGSIPFDTFAPCVGFFDYPCTVAGLANGPDIAEGVPFTTTLYGATRTYMPSKTNIFGSFYSVGSGPAFCMRYD